MGYTFDGSGDRLTRSVTNFGSGWTEYTVCSWIKSNLTNTDKGWFQLAAPSGGDRFSGVRYDAAGASGGALNILKFGVYVNSVEVQCEAVAQTQTTNVQHVVGRWQSGSNAEIWLDGVDASGFQNTTQVGGLNTGQNLILLGAGPKDGTGNAWDGIVYEHRVYSRWLSQGEIETLYATRGADGIIEGLEIYYGGNEGAPGVSIPGTTDIIKNLTTGSFDLTLAQGNPTYSESILRCRIPNKGQVIT